VLPRSEKILDFKPYRKTFFANEENEAPEAEGAEPRDWSLVDEIPSAIVLIAPTGEFLYANQRALMALSIEIEPLSDVDAIFEMLPSEGQPASLGALLPRLMPGQEEKVVARLRANPGKEFLLELKGSKQGDVFFATLSVHESNPRDVLDLKAVIASLRELGRSIPNASVLLYNRELRFMLAVGEALAEAGYDPETVKGKTLHEVIEDPKTIAMLEPSYEKALAGFATELMHKSPSTGREYHTQFLPIHNRDDEVIAGAVFTLDVTQYKQLERQFERQAAQLKLVNEDLEELAYISSHDLRAPLRRLRQLVSWTREDLGDKLDTDIEHYTDLMLERLGRLETFHDSLLSYVRAGQRAEKPQRVLLSALVWQVWRELGDPHAFELRTHNVAEVEIDVHAELLRDVLRELLSNSIQHHDSEYGLIEVGYVREEFEHLFIVRDDGPGIPNAYHDRVFKVAERLAFEGSESHRGLGIGLALVKRLVSVHGGAVRIIPRPTSLRGLSVEFSLPVEFNEDRT